MKSNAHPLLSAKVADKTPTYTRIQLFTNFEELGFPLASNQAASWSMDLDHRIGGPMGPEKAAAYVAERYYIDNPEELLRVRREALTAIILHVLCPPVEY